MKKNLTKNNDPNETSDDISSAVMGLYRLNQLILCFQFDFGIGCTHFLVCRKRISIHWHSNSPVSFHSHFLLMFTRLPNSVVCCLWVAVFFCFVWLSFLLSLWLLFLCAHTTNYKCNSFGSVARISSLKTWRKLFEKCSKHTSNVELAQIIEQTTWG